MERELTIGNTMFRKDMYKYTCVRQPNRRVVGYVLTGYVLVLNDRVGRPLDAEVRRGVGGGMSDYFLVEGRLRLNTKQGRRRETSVRRALKAGPFSKVYL